MEPDVKEIYEKSEVPKDVNTFAFVLDRQGRLVHSFHALQGNRRGNSKSDFKTELTEAIAKLKLTNVKTRRTNDREPTALPDLKGGIAGVPAGVRLFLNSPGNVPIVEVVPMKPEMWKMLTLDDGSSARTIRAEVVRDWLVQVDPAGIRTAGQEIPFKRVSGLLKLEPAGSDDKFRYTLLYGRVLLQRGERDEGGRELSSFTGTLSTVITSSRGASDVQSLKGIIEGTYV